MQDSVKCKSRALRNRNQYPSGSEDAQRERQGVRKEYKKQLKEWEQEWWELLSHCEEAMQRQDLGEMYSILIQLDLVDNKVPKSEATLISAETSKWHFQKVQEHLDENDLAEKIQVRWILRSNAKTSEEGRQAAKRLNITPSETEIIWEWSKIKERAPGEDGFRMIYRKAAPAHFQAKVVKVSQAMFDTPA